ncbi:MAG: DNA adenine methylase [Thermoplasmata archaeon]
MKINSIFPYFGGKFNQMSRILEILKDNLNKFDIVADVFSGSGKVLINIPNEWKKIKVYNDIDKELYITFKVLQDKEKKELLKEKLALAFPHAGIFEELRDGIIKPKNDIDIAFKVIYLHTYSFSGDGKSFGRRFKYRNVYHFTEDNLKKLDLVNEDWLIENKDFRKFMDIYNKKTVLIYLDPPYITWGSKLGYNYTFSVDDFMDLKEKMDKHQGSYLMNLSLSGEGGDIMLDIFGNPNEIIEYPLPQHSQYTYIKTWKCGFWYKFID